MPSAASLCPKCAGEVRDGWRVCPACAAPLDAETKTIFTESPSISTIEEGRFPAGTVLAGRYRILGLLGHGGMGEVYRAYDLILNQAVALKFLAGGHGQMSEAALARFRNEVRIARQVSHPNVCRVYDIGFIEGMHFLSMEYLDGEDLDSLLRRIGRLPQDKAIEFTRKICAGLSAAHDRGVLHRDLKPANIMIDGRGQARVTDFGLAALAAEIPLSDIRSGTPAYMS
jgi:serine/threonine-protein kinase